MTAGRNGVRAAGARSLVVLLLGLVAIGVPAGATSPPAPKPRAVPESHVGPAPLLSADLVPPIGDSAVRTVLARIARVDLTPSSEGGLSVDTGEVSLTVAEALSPVAPPPGPLTVPARRVSDPIVRLRNTADQWNALSLRVGDLLIIAVHESQPAGHGGASYEAVAAEEVDSPDAALVRAVRRAYAIERVPSPSDQKRALMRSALLSGDAFLTRYAADALARRGVLGRDAGAQLMAEAMDADAVGPAARFALAGPLSDFFDPGRGSDPVNVLVVTELARGFAAEPDAARRGTWAAYLASRVLYPFSESPAAAEQTRTALVAKVNRPAPSQMVALLNAFAQAHPDDDRARRLVHAWRRAHPQR